MTGLTRVDLAGGLDHVDDVQVVQRPLAEGGVAGAGTAGAAGSVLLISLHGRRTARTWTDGAD